MGILTRRKKVDKREKVTKWYVWNDDQIKWMYNHFEYGHSEEKLPKGTYEQEHAWAKSEWMAKHAYLDVQTRQIHETET
jgi:hypothetical protein